MMGNNVRTFLLFCMFVTVQSTMVWTFLRKCRQQTLNLMSNLIQIYCTVCQFQSWHIYENMMFWTLLSAFCFIVRKNQKHDDHKNCSSKIMYIMMRRIQLIKKLKFSLLKICWKSKKTSVKRKSQETLRKKI